MITWSPGMTLESGEQMIIEAALKFYRGNKTATASALDIAIRTLDNKLEIYNGKRRDQEAAFERANKERDGHLARQRQRPEAAPHVRSTITGVQLEPASEFATEPKMPVSVGAEVQEVLSRPAGKGSSRKTG